MIKVSVVVPVYNPGHDIDDCIRTIVFEQSLPTDEYEVIFVDDGSTDDTPARLDELAAEHDHVRVEHIPNSGWPGRPRNVGTDLARGEFVYYVDNDDWLAPEALERMYAMAVADEADIVIGKVVSNGKSVPRTLFAKNRHATSIKTAPSLLSLLTPHKLFRRSLLTEHAIRHPEGRRRLEDHVFVVHAYLHTDRISVLSDYTCYHWMLRGENASRVRFDPPAYYGAVREVLDIVERHTEPGPFRERVMAHWYRGKLMKRSGPLLTRRDPEYARTLYEEVRAVALERFGDWIHDHMRFNLRVRSWLLRSSTFEALLAFAELEGAMTVDATVTGLRPEGSSLVLRFDARVHTPDGPLAFAQEGDSVRWLAPPPIADELTPQQLDAGEDLEDSSVELLLRQPDTGIRFLVPSSVRVHLEPVEDGGGPVTPVLSVESAIDPAAAAAGAALPEGDWHVIGNVIAAGFMQPMRVQHPDGRGLQLTVTSDGRVVPGAVPEQKAKKSKKPKKPGTKLPATAPSPWRRAAGVARRLADRLPTSDA